MMACRIHNGNLIILYKSNNEEDIFVFLMYNKSARYFYKETIIRKLRKQG